MTAIAGIAQSCKSSAHQEKSNIVMALLVFDNQEYRTLIDRFLSQENGSSSLFVEDIWKRTKG